YGREGKPYEDATFECPKQDDCIWLEEPAPDSGSTYCVGNAVLKVINITDSNYFHTLDDSQNVMFLKGGLVAEYGINVAGPGDIVAASIL